MTQRTPTFLWLDLGTHDLVTPFTAAKLHNICAAKPLHSYRQRSLCQLDIFPAVSPSIVSSSLPRTEGRPSIADSRERHFPQVDQQTIIKRDSGFVAEDTGDGQMAKVLPSSSDLASHSRQQLLGSLAHSPLHKYPTPSGLIDRPCRWTAYQLMPGETAVNKRKTNLELCEEQIARGLTDPSLPAMVLTRRAPGRDAQSTWILTMPWEYVLPIWYCLMYQRMSDDTVRRPEWKTRD